MHSYALLLQVNSHVHLKYTHRIFHSCLLICYLSDTVSWWKCMNETLHSLCKFLQQSHLHSLSLSLSLLNMNCPLLMMFPLEGECVTVVDMCILLVLLFFSSCLVHVSSNLSSTCCYSTCLTSSLCTLVCLHKTLDHIYDCMCACIHLCTGDKCICVI